MSTKQEQPIEQLKGSTELRFAVLGNPISHSLSPMIHGLFAKQTGINLTYERIEVNLDLFASALETLIRQGYNGFNVTLPFKEEAYEFCVQQGTLDPQAAKARAINTLLIPQPITDLSTIKAYNTDGMGLVADIHNRLKFNLTNQRVLVIGAGGAARGIIPALQTANAAVFITNRTLERAKLIASWFDIQSVPLSEIQDSPQWANHSFDVIINATSSEMTLSGLNLSDQLYQSTKLVYDLMYRKDRALTVFLQQAKDCQVSTISDGLGMLVEQAAEAFFIWNGVRPDTTQIMAQIEAFLAQPANPSEEVH
jgi:shikimate dehydrogenase